MEMIYMKISILIILFCILTATCTLCEAKTTSYSPRILYAYMEGADGEKIVLKNNNSAVNPTYVQLIDFIRKDETDKIGYDWDKFTCGDYAERLHNNAEKKGYKAGWVYITFKDLKMTHACNAFNTKDKGLIFIDCTGGFAADKENYDSKATIKKGSAYKRTPLFRNGHKFSDTRLFVESRTIFY